MMVSQPGSAIARHVLTAMLCIVGSLAAQEPSAPIPSSAPLRYRRVYVPVDQLEQFTRGHKLLKRDEFPQLVERIDARVQASHSDAAWIQSAEYSAVFSNGQLTSGLAQLGVVHSAVGTTVLFLSPCGLAMGSATWQGAEAAEEAVVGSDLQGNLVAEVRDSNELHFPWTLRGETNEWGETHFDVVLPPAPMNRLIVDLPDDYELLSDRGMISRFEDRGVDEEPPLHALSGVRRWVVQLGGTNHFRLIVASQDAMRRRKQLVSLQQDTLYRLADDGLEVECNVELGVQRDPLEVLLFGVDPQLQITSVRLGNRDVSWSLLDEQDGRSRQLQVRFAEPLSGIHRTLQLSAVGPLRTAETWRLPQILPQGVFWRQGTMSLLLPETLELRHLLTQNARQSDATPADASTKLAARRFQLFAPDGLLEINVVRRTRKLSGAIGTTIELEPSATTAQVVADLSSVVGQRYLLEADVPNAWTIDSIETEPSNSVEDYQFVAYDSGSKRLQIRLSQPLTPSRPMRFMIRAHRAPTFVLQADDFRPLRFANVDITSHLVAIAPDPSFRLDVSGDVEVEQVDPDALSPTTANLLHPRSGGMVFQDGQRADTMTIKVTREDPTFAAEIYVLAEADANTLSESYRLVCTPESTPLTSLLVFLSESRPEEISWSMATDTNALLSAQKVSLQELQPARVNQTGEAWELILRNPQDKPFEIRGQRKSAFAATKTIALATLPKATSQEGWLTIESLDASALAIKASGARPIPCAPVEPEKYSTSRARYRFDPSRNAQVMVDHMSSRSTQAPLWAWDCLLSSQLLATGESLHHADYLLESTGGLAFQVRLPPDCLLSGLEINGTEASPPLSNEASRGYTVALPSGMRFPRVRVTYTAPRKRLGIFSRIVTQFPEVDIPVLDRHWTVWLPPGYQPVVGQPMVGPQGSPSSRWSPRLLGALAAGAGEHPFRLFSSQDWSSLVNSQDSQRGASVYGQLFLQQLGDLYLELQTRSAATRLTWRDLLVAYQQRAESLGDAPRIWIDASRLSEEDFSLDDPVPVVTRVAPLQVASDLLAYDELVITAQDKELLLTSQDGLARMPGAVQPTSQPGIVAVRADSLLAVELQSLEKWPSADLVPLSAWIATPVVAGKPWERRRDPARRGIGKGDWRACEVAVGADGGCELSIEHPQSLWSIGWAVLLITVGFVSWLGSRWSRFVYPLALVTAVFSMSVSDLWVPVSSNIFLGTLLAGLVIGVRRLVPRHAEPDRGNARSETSSNLATTFGLLILAVVLVFGTRHVRAAEEAADTKSADSKGVYQMLVPIDKNLQPVGDYDYLPLEFYDALDRRDREGTTSPRDWLVRGAVYRAVFNWTEQRSSLDLTSMTAVYQLELFRPQQRINFPWNEKDRAVQLLEVRLAGQPVELVWNADRTAFSFKVLAEGINQLEFVLLPLTRDEAGERNLQFPIPPIAQSQLQIETPFDAPHIEVPSAVGEERVAPETGEQLVELGPARTLALRWPSGTASRVNPRQLDVQQLMWLKVRPKDRPDTVLLDTKFRIQSSGDRIGPLTVHTDSRLRLLPAPGEQSVEITNANGGNGDSTALIVTPSEPVERELALHLQFWIMNTTGLGNLSLPRLEILDSRVQRRWLAVSVAPDLEYNAGDSDALTPMDAAEFLTVWGEAESAPNLCYRMEADDPLWSISTRSRQPRSESQQQLDVSVGHSSMDLVFSAEVETANGSAFQHQLSVPRDLQVTSVTVTHQDSVSQQDSVIPAEAYHDGSGSLTLFLGQGVTGHHHVQLRGTQTITPGDAAISIPEVTLQGATTKSHQIRLYRQANVLVSVHAPPAWKPTESQGLGQFRDFFGRLVAAFDLPGNRTENVGSATIQVRPNQLALDARMVTTLRRVDDKWEAVMDCQALVAPEPEGVMDQFRFEIPAEWSGPFTVEPDFPFEVRPLPGQRRHLIIRPPQPVTDRFAVRIRGVLVLGANERGRTPNIVPLDVTHADRYFILPTQLDQQRIDWETSGLQLVPLRDVVAGGPVDSRALIAYRVYSRPRAVIADIQRVAGERQISLADVHIMCRPGGEVSGLVSFDLEPAGASSCTLEVPNDCDLIQASIEGIPAALIPLADRRWHFRLASEQLPQQLVILFKSRCSDAPSHTAQQFPIGRIPARGITVPWITDFDVVRTLWTVHGFPRTMSEAEDIEPHRVSAAAQEAIRLRTMANLVESAVETVMGSPATEIHAWYTPWAVRLASSDARVARDGRLVGGTDMSLDTAAVEALDRQQGNIARRLNTSPTVQELRAQTKRHPQPSDLLAFAQHAGVDSRHYAFIGKVPTIALSWQVPRQGGLGHRLWGVCLVAALGGLVGYGLRKTSVKTWLRQWPCVPGVLIGLAWWLLASPSLLGWVIVAASLWAAWRWPLPAQAVREPATEPTMESAV